MTKKTKKWVFSGVVGDEKKIKMISLLLFGKKTKKKIVVNFYAIDKRGMKEKKDKEKSDQDEESKKSNLWDGQNFRSKNPNTGKEGTTFAKALSLNFGSEFRGRRDVNGIGANDISEPLHQRDFRIWIVIG